MKIKKLNIRLSDKIPVSFLFYIAFAIYIFISILTTSFYAGYIAGTKHKLILVFCFMLLCLKEILSLKYSSKRAIGLAVCMFCLSIVFLTATRTPLLVFMCFIAFIFTGKDENFEKIAKVAIWVSVIAVILVIVSAKLGIIKNIVGGDYVDEELGRKRDYLGFRYTLYPSAFLFNITALTVYCNKQKIKWLTLAVITAANVWVYVQTASRLSFFTSLLLIIIAAFMKIRPNFINNKKILSGLMIGSFIILAVISFILALSYSPFSSWMSKLDELVGTRISLANKSLSIYGVKIFGENIPWAGWGYDADGNRQTTLVSYLFVDCMYIQIMQRYGPVFFTLMISALTWTQYRLYKTGNYYLMIIFTFIAIRSFFDDLYFYLHYNTFWLVVGMALIGRLPRNLSDEFNKKLSKIGFKVS